METIRVKLPSGKIAAELFHFMGGDDDVHYSQRSPIAQQLIDKFYPAKTVELTKEEFVQLIKEVDNAADILQDHVGDGGWTGAMQFHLNNFLRKLTDLTL